MNDIIQVVDRQIGDSAVQTVNARDLHAFLGVGSAFKDWIARRIEDYGFEEAKDFCSFLSESSGGRPAKEYALSLDMAKELAMVERNDKGKQARQYFIECERRAKATSAPAFAIPQTMPEALRLAADLAERNEKLALENQAQAQQLAEAAPKVRGFDLITAGEQSITIRESAKLLGVKENRLTAWLHQHEWIYRLNGRWVAKAQHIQAGRLIYKEARYTDQNTGHEVYAPYCHITSKGLEKLAKVFGGEHMPMAA